MAILTLGLSYRRAPIDLLERLAFGDDDLVKAYRLAAEVEGIRECVILSTCNRVEIYADVPAYHDGFVAIRDLFTAIRGVDAAELAEPLYAHWDRDAAEHLFVVASGLDSMVIGETQIQAQVREALRRAGTEDAAGPVLTGAFHAAGRAGRRVREETGLGAAADAFVALGADLAAEALGTLDGRSLVVVGAGQMASLAVKHLRDRGVVPIRILNRSIAHARALAARTGADSGALETLSAVLEDADLVVSATGAAGHVLHHGTVAAAMRHRAGRPVVLLDLAVPRDVDPEVAYVDGARVIDIVSLRERLGEHDERTVEDIANARAIVAEEVRRYIVRRRGDEFAPLIRAIRSRGDEVVRSELDRHASRLSSLTPDERTAVDALARGIAAKLLHDPIVELKERSEPGTEGIHARLLAELLGLDGDVG